MSFLSRAVLATAIAGVGLASGTGAALADESTGDAGTTQQGMVNVGDVQTITPLNACNNDVPVNALGVQVPVQDLGLSLPVLSGSDGDKGGNSSTDAKTCGTGVDSAN